MSLSTAIHRMNARTSIPDWVAKVLAALLVGAFAVELVVRPILGYFGAELTRPLSLLVLAASFALFFAGAIRRQIARRSSGLRVPRG